MEIFMRNPYKAGWRKKFKLQIKKERGKVDILFLPVIVPYPNQSQSNRNILRPAHLVKRSHLKALILNKI